jgi:hypothetical protein
MGIFSKRITLLAIFVAACACSTVVAVLLLTGGQLELWVAGAFSVRAESVKGSPVRAPIQQRHPASAAGIKKEPPDATAPPVHDEELILLHDMAPFTVEEERTLEHFLYRGAEETPVSGENLELKPGAKCKDLGGGKNYCTSWCNQIWGCGAAADGDYSCECKGCNGCTK